MIKSKSTFAKFICIILVLGACKKGSNDEPSNSNTNVSGKIKRIVYSNPSTRKASIKTFEYDGNNRISKLNYWMEDSSSNPVTITYKSYSSLSYDGTNQFPNKNTITKDLGEIDSTLYYYDLQNRITKEDFYIGSQVGSRNTYSYLSPGVILQTYYVLIGSTLLVSTIDSLLYNSQNKLLEMRFYAENGTYRGNATFEYDDKSNPLSSISAFTYIYSLNNDDFGLLFRAPNNLIKTIDNQSSGTYITNYTLNYSLNSFPINGTSTTNTSSTISTITYDYY